MVPSNQDLDWEVSFPFWVSYLYFASLHHKGDVRDCAVGAQGVSTFKGSYRYGGIFPYTLCAEERISVWAWVRGQ